LARLGYVRRRQKIQDPCSDNDRQVGDKLDENTMNRNALVHQRRLARQRDANWFSQQRFQDAHEELLRTPSAKFLEEQEDHRQNKDVKDER
jgi:hypothetical protein